MEIRRFQCFALVLFCRPTVSFRSLAHSGRVCVNLYMVFNSRRPSESSEFKRNEKHQLTEIGQFRSFHLILTESMYVSNNFYRL